LFVVAIVSPRIETPVAQPMVSNEYGPVIGGLQAGLSLSQRMFGPKDPIELHYQVRNVGTGPRIVWHSGFWPNHLVLVQDASGRQSPMTALGTAGRNMFSPGGPRFKNVKVTLLAGNIDDTEGRFDLHKLFVLLPGTYSVQVVYEERAEGWRGRLPSNVVHFEIAER
jgi:hypothetical protein